MQMVQEPEILRGYENARRKVAETLSNLNFARVVSIVQMPPKFQGKENIFQGEVEEVFSGKHSKASARHAFFSKFSRNSMGVSVIGCFSIVDSAMGTEHVSSVPQLGDILVGSFVSATQRGKLPFEFKGWCNNGKPLLELLRIIQFGSRMSKGEIHSLLRQPASVTANFALRLQEKFLKVYERAEAQKAASAQDDIWLLARVLCFRDLEPDDKLKLSKPHFDILTQLAMTTLDEALLDDLQQIMPPKDESIIKETDFTGFVTGNKTPPWGNYGVNTSEKFQPSSPSASPPRFAPSPPYKPSSPEFAPSSPPYAPSPMPSSPPYKPPSPNKPPSPPNVSLPPDALASLPSFQSAPKSILGKLLGSIDTKTLDTARGLVSYAEI